MIASVTERPTYKRCRLQWDLGSRNRQALTPIFPATALALGTYVHEALGNWIIEPDTKPKVYFLRAAKAARESAIETYRAQTGAGPSDGELDKLDAAILMGAFMAENYELHWKKPLPDDFEVIAQEQRVCVPIPGTEHTEEWVYDPSDGLVWRRTYDEPRFHYLEGRLDGIIKDKRGRLYVLEHKTYNIRPREDVLRTTDQFLAYTWILKQLDLGFPVAGVAYDGLWKRDHVPKTVDGRKGTLADLFLRMRLERSPEELATFEDELRLEVLEMASDPSIYRNRTSDGSCYWSCGFEPLCTSMMRGEDSEYVRRTRYTQKASDPALDLALREAD